MASGRVRKTAAEAIEANYNRIQVERLLEAQLGDDESTGFFEGQFKDLEAFGRDKAVPVLIRILAERTYAFRHAERHDRSDAFRGTMKELAVMALGELGGEGALPALKAFANDEAQIGLSRRIREETLVALHRQGERSRSTTTSGNPGWTPTGCSAPKRRTSRRPAATSSSRSGCCSPACAATRRRRRSTTSCSRRWTGTSSRTRASATIRPPVNLACLNSRGGARRKPWSGSTRR